MLRVYQERYRFIKTLLQIPGNDWHFIWERLLLEVAIIFPIYLSGSNHFLVSQK